MTGAAGYRRLLMPTAKVRPAQREATSPPEAAGLAQAV